MTVAFEIFKLDTLISKYSYLIVFSIETFCTSIFSKTLFYGRDVQHNLLILKEYINISSKGNIKSNFYGFFCPLF